MAMSDGSVARVAVLRGLASDGTWTLSIKTMEEIDKGDGRIITALKWVDVCFIGSMRDRADAGLVSSDMDQIRLRPFVVNAK